jgi:hypothetical protein
MERISRLADSWRLRDILHPKFSYDCRVKPFSGKEAANRRTANNLWRICETFNSGFTIRSSQRGREEMKQFQVDVADIKKTGETFYVAGLSVGDEPIAIGDYLNGLEVVKIVAYGKEINECPPGLTAGLTLSFAHRNAEGFQRDYFLVTLTGDC